MGLGYGALRNDIADALAPLIRSTEPDATPTDIVEISNIVIDHLLNDTNRRLQFEEPYVAFDGTSGTWRRVQFHLLKEEEADDDTTVLKATNEAINLYAGMLDVDVEDAQTAAEAVLQAQIARGAIGSAVATARQARLRSIEYVESIRNMIRQVHRDVSRVDAREMLRTVAAARLHLAERLRVERGLWDAVNERLATAEVADAPSLVELNDTLDDCYQRHLKLHTELLSINDTWLIEQERQRFRRARQSALPDVERDVLYPLRAATLEEVDAILDSLLLPFHAPCPSKALDLAGLVDTLLTPRRTEREPDLEAPADDLDPIATNEVRFDEATVRRVEALIARGGGLSALLHVSRDADDPPPVRRLLVLRALWAWDPDDQETIVTSLGGRLTDVEYVGQDVSFGEP
jgi:hypothetical protein